MEASVRTYGGEEVVKGFFSVKHWTLYVDNQYISGTSNPEEGALFERIAEKINA